MAETIAVIGGDTLLGREVREVLGESALGSRLLLVAGEEEESGKLTEIDGAAAFLAKLDPNAIEDAAVLVLTGTTQSSREAMAANPVGAVVDLTYATEEDEDSRVRAPQVEGSEYVPDHTGPQVIAHPAAIAIALILHKLQNVSPIMGSIVHIFEPASERGKAGVDELQQQTVSLLAFKEMPRRVFDTQVSFTMLAQLGEEAQPGLQDVEERIERHLATLLDRGDGIPMPSLRLIQAPVFHGHSLSLWVEFEDAPPVAEVEEALVSEFIEVRVGDQEAPNNRSVVGQGGVSAGSITPDRNNGNAIWIWLAVDNLRLMAETAAMVVQEAV